MGRRGVSSSLIFTVLAAPLALGGCAMTSTYGTGEAPELALLHEVTGGLVTKPKKNKIDYEPRAPLVMPSSDALPPPAEAAAATDPNWPADPNQPVLASAASGEDFSGATAREQYKQTRPLAGLLPGGATTPGPRSDNDVDRQATYEFIRQSRQQHATFDKALADANGFNPNERRYLTDPPLGYEQPTDTAPTEYEGVGKKRGFWRRLFPGS